MVDKVFDYVQKHQMIKENDYVVAGVSGGADSVCLLFMLLEIRKKIDFQIHVVHINHMIREEAMEDASYVEQLCKKYDIPYTLVEENVEEIARLKHISTEEAGREVRYRAFNDVLQKKNAGERGKIAIAHNQNDCSETFLFHLFRGSGLKGLSGITPVRDHVIRPILCLTRDEIEEYLEKNQIAFCIDKTNLEDNYTRNKIRHHILPYAEKEISAQATKHIAEACEKIQAANALIEEQKESAYKKCIKIQGKQYHIHDFSEISKTIVPYVLQQVLEDLAGSRKDISAIHIEQMQDLFTKQCGRQIDLPYGLEAVKEYDGICVRKKQGENHYFEYSFTASDYERLENHDEVVISLPNGGELVSRLVETGKNIPINPCTKWLDYGKIKDSIVVRNRKIGDYLTMDVHNHHKSLKSFFVDEKIPKDMRDQVYLVTENSHVLWIIGNRISNYYKIDKDTKTIIEFLYRGGN